MPKTVDTADRRILDVLQRDGRITVLKLAESVALSPSPCLRRVRRLESEGLIEDYCARLSRRKVGLTLTVFVEVKVVRHTDADAKSLVDSAMAMDEVVNCYIISGEYDILMEVVVSDLEAYRRFMMEKLTRVVGLQSFQSRFVIDVIKNHVPLPLDHLA